MQCLPVSSYIGENGPFFGPPCIVYNVVDVSFVELVTRIVESIMPESQTENWMLKV